MNGESKKQRIASAAPLSPDKVHKFIIRAIRMMDWNMWTSIGRISKEPTGKTTNWSCRQSVAMDRGLNIGKVDSSLFAEKKLVEKKLHFTFSKEKARKLWDKVPKSLRQEPSVWYVALERGVVSFEELPEHLKTNESVLMALQIGRKQLDWFKLPTRYQSDEDCAIACFEQSPYNNVKAWKCVR